MCLWSATLCVASAPPTRPPARPPAQVFTNDIGTCHVLRYHIWPLGGLAQGKELKMQLLKINDVN